jgi:hypothetical protein
MSLTVPIGTRSVFTTPTSPSVLAVRWPEERALRDELAAGRVPRVLVVAAGAEPPHVVDELEDWIREPLVDQDLVARCQRVAGRAVRASAVPFVDADGLVWHDDRWTDIPDGQLEVARTLVRRIGQVVPAAELVALYAQGGGSDHREALKAAMTRLGRRFASVGLTLTKVRGGGYILDAAPASAR